MKAIEYSKAHGFRDVLLEPPEIEGESFREWGVRAGFEEHGLHDGLESVRDYGHSVAIRVAADRKDGSALVEVGDSDSYDLVIVRSRAELLNLRMALVPFHAIALGQRIDAVCSMAEKAFHAWHGHKHYHVCRECDPDEWAREQRAQEKRLQKEKAK